MVVAGLVHGVLILVEDLLVYLGGKAGIPFWIVLGISLLAFYFYWNQIFSFTKAVLRRLGL